MYSLSVELDARSRVNKAPKNARRQYVCLCVIFACVGVFFTEIWEIPSEFFVEFSVLIPADGVVAFYKLLTISIEVAANITIDS